MCLSLDLSPCHFFLLLLPRLLLLVSHLLLNLLLLPHVLLLRHVLLLHCLHSYTHLCCHLIYLIFFFRHLLPSLPNSFPSLLSLLLSSLFYLYFLLISHLSPIPPPFFFPLFFLFFFFSLVARLVSSDILESLSSNFEQHAGDEKMAEWAYVSPSPSFFNSHFHIFLSSFFNRFSNFFIFL